jgi:hypothetical protein
MGYWMGDFYMGDPADLPAYDYMAGQTEGGYQSFVAPPSTSRPAVNYDINSVDNWDAYDADFGGANTGGAWPGLATNNPFMALAKSLGMSPGEAIKWQQDYGASTGIPDFFKNSENHAQALRALAASKGVGGAPGIESLANAAYGAHHGWMDSQKELDARWRGGDLAAQILKGASFALTPAVIGPAIAGTAGLGAANFGGGLAGDVLSGTGLKALRTGLSAAGTGLNALESGQSVAAPQGISADSSLSNSVLSQNTQAPSVSAPQSLSNSVMTTSTPQNVVRRPQIRLSPGFRRGQ